MSRVMNDELLLTDEEISEALIKSPSRFDVYKHNAEVAKAQLKKVQSLLDAKDAYKSVLLEQLDESARKLDALKQENEGLRKELGR